MTDLNLADGGTFDGARHAPVIESAVVAADAAARAAGVTIRELRMLADLEAVCALYDSIWHPSPSSPPITTELLRALAKAGNYVAGAFDGPRLVGACVGFFGQPADSTMHSHIAGVSADMRGRSVGFALKLHQRAWALLREVSVITWTFDPLVGRNAYFNLGKLAAEPVEYLTNFYGGMNDGINGAGDTDRLLVRWQLDAPDVAAACAGMTTRSVDADAAREAGACVALELSSTGAPVARRTGVSTLLVGVPRDIEAMRRSSPDCAHRWRVALRELLTELLDSGAVIAGFDRSGWYLIQRQASPADDLRREGLWRPPEKGADR